MAARRIDGSVERGDDTGGRRWLHGARRIDGDVGRHGAGQIHVAHGGSRAWRRVGSAREMRSEAAHVGLGCGRDQCLHGWIQNIGDMPPFFPGRTGSLGPIVAMTNFVSTTPVEKY
jgi:hypothetical protein